EYLRGGSLWVYVFDDSDNQTPPAYLAKAPVPLRPLAAGRAIRGDYVLRDTGGGPRGMVRVFIQWRYPFQPPESSIQAHMELDRPEKEMERSTRAEELPRPVAKPRMMLRATEARVDRTAVQKHTKMKPHPPPIKLRPPQHDGKSERAKSVTSKKGSGATPLQSPVRKRATPLSSPAFEDTPPFTLGPSHTKSTRSAARKQGTRLKSPEVKGQSSPGSEMTLSRSLSAQSPRSSTHDDKTDDKDIPSLMSLEEVEEEPGGKSEIDGVGSDIMESTESSSSNLSDVIIVPPPSRRLRKVRLNQSINQSINWVSGLVV
ncbi:hypothetical protein UPYG_G00236270, partial [Umbra pygmaea]